MSEVYKMSPGCLVMYRGGEATLLTISYPRHYWADGVKVITAQLPPEIKNAIAERFAECLRREFCKPEPFDRE